MTKARSNATAPNAKGTLVVGSGTDASTTLAVGTDNYVLTADSAEASGIKWAAAGSGFNGASAKKTSAQSYSAGAATLITFDSEDFDTNNYHDNVTNNSRLTIPTTGYYQITINTGQSQYSTLDGSTNYAKSQVLLYKNGSGYSGGLSDTSWSQIEYATAGDYFQFYFYCEGSLTINGKFQIQFLGA